MSGCDCGKCDDARLRYNAAKSPAYVGINIVEWDGYKSQAECIGQDPNIFFANDSDTELLKQAKAICGACPIAKACLEYAITISKESDGIYGGFTGNDRDRIIRLRRKLKKSSKVS